MRGRSIAVRRLGLALLAVLVALPVTGTVWLSGCDENPDCGGVSLAAYYVVYALIAAGVILVVALVAAVRRTRS